MQARRSLLATTLAIYESKRPECRRVLRVLRDHVAPLNSEYRNQKPQSAIQKPYSEFRIQKPDSENSETLFRIPEFRNLGFPVVIYLIWLPVMASAYICSHTRDRFQGSADSANASLPMVAYYLSAVARSSNPNFAAKPGGALLPVLKCFKKAQCGEVLCWPLQMCSAAQV